MHSCSWYLYRSILFHNKAGKWYSRHNYGCDILTMKSSHLFEGRNDVTLSGWPRHRENREFGSYFFQTGKTQGILLWHRENFWDTGKIFYFGTGRNLDTGKIIDCRYWNKKYVIFLNFKFFLPCFARHKSSLQSIIYFYSHMLFLLFYFLCLLFSHYIDAWYWYVRQENKLMCKVV